MNALRICVVSDGRRGIENQALGLAEAVGRRVPVDLGRWIIPPPRALAPRKLAPPPAFDLWIGCGRAAVAAARAHKRGQPNALFVYVQDPKAAYAVFDVIVAPAHDRLSADRLRPDARLVTLIGSPNRITAARLAEAALDPVFAGRIAQLSGPKVAALIGGASKRHKLDAAAAKLMLDGLDRLVAQGAALLITTSRRTGDGLAEALSSRFAAAPNAWVWRSDADGPNPYFAFLAACDVALVTQDSTNMLTEAASAGKPVLIARAAGRSGKFQSLYDALIERGSARWFKGELETWPVEALAETEAAAEIVINHVAPRLAERRSGD